MEQYLLALGLDHPDQLDQDLLALGHQYQVRQDHLAEKVYERNDIIVPIHRCPVGGTWASRKEGHW